MRILRSGLKMALSGVLWVVSYLLYGLIIFSMCVTYSALLLIFVVAILGSYVYHSIKFRKSFHKECFEMLKEAHYHAKDIAGF